MECGFSEYPVQSYSQIHRVSNKEKKQKSSDLILETLQISQSTALQGR